MNVPKGFSNGRKEGRSRGGVGEEGREEGVGTERGRKEGRK
jgi:hypothetical protein